MVRDFRIDKVSKSGAKFDIEKLSFFNSMHIRIRYSYQNDLEAKQAVSKWRDMLLKLMDSEFHEAINEMSDEKMLKVMDMMKVRLRFPRDIHNHGYLFHAPNYDSELGLKF